MGWRGETSGIRNLHPGSSAAKNVSSTVLVCPRVRIIEKDIRIKLPFSPVNEDVVAVLAGVVVVVVVAAVMTG